MSAASSTTTQTSATASPQTQIENLALQAFLGALPLPDRLIVEITAGGVLALAPYFLSAIRAQNTAVDSSPTASDQQQADDLIAAARERGLV